MAPYEQTDTNSQLLLLLVVVSWHTGEGFSLAQRVSAEGGATESPERHSGGVMGRCGGRWVELRACVERRGSIWSVAWSPLRFSLHESA